MRIKSLHVKKILFTLVIFVSINSYTQSPIVDFSLLIKLVNENYNTTDSILTENGYKALSNKKNESGCYNFEYFKENDEKDFYRVGLINKYCTKNGVQGNGVFVHVNSKINFPMEFKQQLKENGFEYNGVWSHGNEVMTGYKSKYYESIINSVNISSYFDENYKNYVCTIIVIMN